jgi:hypothetical protein
MRQLTTWQIIRKIQRRFHSRDFTQSSKQNLVGNKDNIFVPISNMWPQTIHVKHMNRTPYGLIHLQANTPLTDINAIHHLMHHASLNLVNYIL